MYKDANDTYARGHEALHTAQQDYYGGCLRTTTARSNENGSLGMERFAGECWEADVTDPDFERYESSCDGSDLGPVYALSLGGSFMR